MVKLAISNIAWEPREFETALSLMVKHGSGGLEIAPGLAFPSEPDPFLPSSNSLCAFKDLIGAYGVVPVSMQSLLFGVSGAFLFGTAAERANFSNGIERAIDLAHRLDVPNIVLGSPKNRVIPSTMERGEADAIAVDVFRSLGARARQANVKIALEPNPIEYGTNFLTTFEEAVGFADLVDHDSITVNFDIGALVMTQSLHRAGELFRAAKKRVSHVHISEPHLSPAPKNGESLARVAAAIDRSEYSGWYSIEMRRDEIGGMQTIDRSLAICARVLSGGCQ